VNILAEELEAFVAALKSDYGVLAASISQIEEQLAAGNINKATGEELLTRLQAGRQNIAETLAHFRVMNPAENQ
jgi:spermidine/putrescine-binding protein